MWQPNFDKIQRQYETERLEQAEKYILYLKETITELEKRVKELEKKNDKENRSVERD